MQTPHGQERGATPDRDMTCPSPFATAAENLASLGYHVLPVRAKEKYPAEFVAGRWHGLPKWQKYRDRQLEKTQLDAMSTWPDANVGVVLGSRAGEHVVIAIDIDARDHDQIQEIVGALPFSPMAKKGAKGITLFYRGDPALKTRNYARGSGKTRCMLCEILTGNATRQTVVPPSIHPQGMAYRWERGPVHARELPILDIDDIAALEETLEGMGWKAASDESAAPARENRASDTPLDGPFADLNADALANLARWVPDLDLYGLRPKQGGRGFQAVATWRDSSTGRATELRKTNLHITPTGIRDFGADTGYSAIDLVMHAQGVTFDAAFAWLSDKVHGDSSVIASAGLKASERDNQQKTIDCSEDLDFTPWELCDPATVPKREWLYGRDYLRGVVTLTIAPGGLGKSTLCLNECVAMVSQTNFFAANVEMPKLKCAYYNLEDSRVELKRKVLACVQRHGLKQDQIKGSLFVNSGLDKPLITASDLQDGVVYEPVFEKLETRIKQHGIDVLVIDPFVSSHDLSENDNSKIDKVAKRWSKLANDCNIAIGLVHHTRKSNGETHNTESARGAKALTDAARVVRVLNQMTASEGDQAGLEFGEHRSYFRIGRDKQNLARAEYENQWMHLASAVLPNGDSVGVVEKWKFPSAIASFTNEHRDKFLQQLDQGDYRCDDRAANWAGHILAPICGLSPENKPQKRQLKKLLSGWESGGIIKREMRLDKHRKEKAHFVRGDEPQIIKAPDHTT